MSARRVLRVNARFWVFWRDGWVKLTLKAGQTLKHGLCAPDEEGHHFEYNQYTFNGDLVMNEWCVGGRDCDGRVQDTGTCACPVDKLRSLPASEVGGPGRPDWTRVKTRCYDEYAERAGY